MPLAVAVISAIAISAATSARPQLARADGLPQPELAAGPFAVLQAVLKKTLLKVEVARVQIRVDQPTQRKLASLAAGRKKSDALEAGIVRAVMDSGEVLITSELRRDVPLDKYMESVYSDLSAARQSGLISENGYWALARQLPTWFKQVRGRGPHKGDRLLCRVKKDSLRVVYRTRDEEVLVDRTVPGGEPGRAVLASYLAPDSTFRKDLIKSLFR